MEKKQQHQHRPSTILSLLEYLEGIPRVERSMNLCDGVIDARKKEVAEINKRQAFFGNPISAGCYYNKITLLFETAAQILKKYPDSVDYLAMLNDIELFPKGFYHRIGVSGQAVAHDVPAGGVDWHVKVIIKKLLAVYESNTRPPRTLPDGITVDPNDILPKDRKRMEADATKAAEKARDDREKELFKSTKKKNKSKRDSPTLEEEEEEAKRLKARRDATKNGTSGATTERGFEKLLTANAEESRAHAESVSLRNTEIQARLKEQHIASFWKLIRSADVYIDDASVNVVAQILRDNGCTVDAVAPYIPEDVVNSIAILMHAGPGAMLLAAYRALKA